MKIILLIRHAKSSWDNSALNDFDRPLNERGKKNAPEMARRLLKQNIKIDLFISSPAKRAKTTAKLFMQEFKRKEKEILLVPQLYHADNDAFNTVIQSMDDSINNIAIFSHNPGITDFANSLCEVSIDNIPTCGIFGISINTDQWNEFSKNKKEFLFFDYPKSEIET
ncbi:MAG TPA: histidine phosphatase family protein [Puia sp.]|nr:histidine phosphatase family protein [Puia sp.]